MRLRLLVSALGFTLALAAPAAAQNRVDQQMFADLRMLQEQMQQLRLTVANLADVVRTVATKQDEQANATRRAFAEQKVITDQLTDSIRILREKGDDTNVRISTLAHELETVRQAVQSLQNSVVQALAAIQAGAPATNPPGGTTGTTGATGEQPAAPAAPMPPPAALQSPQVLYDNAWGDYMASKWDLAIEGFKAYLRSYPTSPDAYKAQFNIGEAYRYSDRAREAVQAYTAVITNYKGTDWEDDAYYGRALVYEKLNQKDQARADFQYILKNFPDSTLAPLSRDALERIK